MDDDSRGGPAGDGTDEDDLSRLIEQVDDEHGGEGAGAMADHLRNRVAETEAAPEEPGDTED